MQATALLRHWSIFSQIDDAMRYFAILSLLALMACSEKTVNESAIGDSTPDNSSANIVEFADKSGTAIKVSTVVIMSDNLEDSEVRLELTEPSSKIEISMEVKENKICAYTFYVVDADGTPYSAEAKLYIPEYGGLRKKVVLQPSWKITKVRNGLNWYNYEGYEPVTGENHVINVLEMDLDNDALKLEFLYYPERKKISEVGNSNSKFVAVTNASFGSGFTSGEPVDNTYIRIDGVNYKEISIGPDDTGNWSKHEAAVWYDGEKELGFISKPNDPHGAIELYKSTTYRNLFSSNVLLFEDGKKSDLNAYSKNYGKFKSRNPCTLLAVTQDRKLLLITIDGRWTDMAAGMSYTELQNFMKAYFNPKYTINMDGGGSTSMFIRGKNVVNYPCEGVSGDTYKPYPGSFKERGLVTYFAIREK